MLYLTIMALMSSTTTTVVLLFTTLGMPDPTTMHTMSTSTI